MFFLVEENQHVKLMTEAFNKKASLTPKNDVTFDFEDRIFRGNRKYDWLLH